MAWNDSKSIPKKNNFNPQLDSFVRWKNVNSFWLHFISTPDTIELTEKIKKNVQNLLDLNWMNELCEEYKWDFITSSTVWYSQFASWESQVTLEESVRWKHTYLFSDPNWDYESSTYHLNDKIINDLLLLEAMKDHWAQTVNLVQGCIPYSRQDKTTPDKRQPISIDFIWGNIARLTWEKWYCITADLHNPTSKGSFKWTNLINLYTWWFVDECIKDIWSWNDNTVLSPADEWWLRTIKAISKEQWLKNIVVIKGRDYSSNNDIVEINIYWDVEWKDIIIHDDMLDTWWTMVKLLEKILILRPKSINLAITHWMFNNDAFLKIQNIIDKSNWVIKHIYVTDSINKEWLPDYVKTISLDNIITNTITSIYKWMSIWRWDATDYSLV